MGSTAFTTSYSSAARSVSARVGTRDRQSKPHGERAFSALERMEEEVRALEGVGKGRWVRWVLGILVLGALLAAGSYFYLQSL